MSGCLTNFPGLIEINDHNSTVLIFTTICLLIAIENKSQLFYFTKQIDDFSTNLTFKNI